MTDETKVITSPEKAAIQERMRRISVDFLLPDYNKVVEDAKKAAESLEAVDAFIEYVNDGRLPEGHVLVTKTDSRISLSSVIQEHVRQSMRRISYPERGTIIYSLSPDGELVEQGEIVTESGSQIFIGDRLIQNDQGLIIYNRELNIGIPAYESVSVVDLSDDPLEGTLGGNHLKRFDAMLELIKEAEPGKVKRFDLGWF